MIIAGIDPGKTGALAILHPDGSAEFFDVPRIKLKGKDKPAWSLWAREWCMALDLSVPDMIVIEDIAARPGQGVTSMFTFGRTLGFVHGLVQATTSCPVHFVTPSVWKAKLGLLNSGKGASREKCRSLYPKTASHLERVKDDGRAEAALLAHYGRKFLC
jgi:crossover junction endodeoxyribonuclease RuvC